MTEIIALSTVKTPEITFEKQENTLYIVGKSYPEDLYAFWQPIIDHVQELLEINSDNFCFDFQLSYHNSGSTRVIINFIKDAERLIAERGSNVRMKWRFDPEDEQSEEQGEDYRDLCQNVTFEMVPQETEL